MVKTGTQQNGLIRLVTIPLVLMVLLLQPVFADAIDDLQPGRWYEVPNSRLDIVDPCPANNCPYTANRGVKGVMDVWSGGAFDTNRNRLIIWGGGHAGYAGNEIYTFDLETFQWERITEPSTQVTGNLEYYPDDIPSSRHTYDSIEYLPTLDLFCSIGGAATYGDGNGGSDELDCFNFQTNQWEKKGTIPGRVYGIASITALDDQGNLWAHGTSGGSRLGRYDTQTNSWSIFAQPAWGLSIRYVATIDKIQHKMYAIGEGQLLVWDLNNPDTTWQTVSTSGATEIERGYYPGLSYHPPSGKLVAWNGGETIYTFDPIIKVWSKNNVASSNSVIPTSATPNGTYGRFRYVPSKDVFVVVNQVFENVYVYRPSFGSGPINPVCGDTLCTHGESCSSCSLDCGTCPVCGYGNIEPGVYR